MNHYNLLKLNTNCDFKEIKRAYFKQAKLCHPDLFNNAKSKEEEFIVGNSPPLHAHIATLFLDLTETEVFMTFREGKKLFYSRKYSAALLLFKKACE